MEASFPEESRCVIASTLRGRGPSPFPVAFSVGKFGGDSICSTVLVWFDAVGDDEFSGELSAALGPKSSGGRGEVFNAEFLSGLADGVGKFSNKDSWSELSVVFEVVLSEAGVVAHDDMFEVLVDQQNCGAEDDEVKVEDGHGGVEIGLAQDFVEDGLNGFEPDRDGASLSGVDVADFEAEPKLRRVGTACHQSRREIAGSKTASAIKDMLIDRRATSHLVRGDKPFVSTR